MWSCKPNIVQTGEESTAEQDTLPSDFLAFYNRFHEDSAYQMDHIIFPLEGLPNSLTGEDSTSTIRFFWQKDEWKLHNHFTDPSQQFDQWYEILNTRVIEHWVQTKGTQLFIRRRFAKLEDGWYLIYYQGVRPVNR